MKDFQDVIREFGFSSDMSIEFVSEELENKHIECLTRYDALVSKGEEDRAEVAASKVKKIESALKILEELKKGIALESDDRELEELRNKGSRGTAYNEIGIGSPNNSQPNIPAPQAVSNDDKMIRNLLNRATQEIEDSNWDDAKKHCDEVLDLDPENTKAYTLFWMAKFSLPFDDIPRKAWEYEKNNGTNVFEDALCQRACKWGGDETKAKMDMYSVGKDYFKALEGKKRANSDEDYQKAAEAFRKLGDYADAAKQAEDCEYYWRKRTYDQIVGRMQKANNTDNRNDIIYIKRDFLELGDFEDCADQIIEADYIDAMILSRRGRTSDHFRMAADMFEKLGEYKDSSEMKESCEKKYNKHLKRELDEKEYKKKRDDLEKELNSGEKTKEYETKIEFYKDKQSKAKKYLKKDVKMGWGYAVAAIAIGVFLTYFGVIGDFLFVDSERTRTVLYVTGIVLGIIGVIFCIFTFDFEVGCFGMIVAYLIFGIVGNGVMIGFDWLYQNYREVVIDQDKWFYMTGGIIIVKLIYSYVKRGRSRNMITYSDSCIYNLIEELQSVVERRYKELYKQYENAGVKREHCGDFVTRVMYKVTKRHDLKFEKR